MTKNEAIKRVNDDLGSAILNEKNTQWSPIVPYGNDEGWWLTIPYLTFKQELHFLLNNEKAKEFRYLKIKANQILSPGTKFRSKDGAADIFMSASKPKKLVDILIGGTKHNFSKYVMGEYRF